MRPQGKDKRRWCEERIISFRAADAKSAISHAKATAKESTYDFVNAQGLRVFFEFVGILDLLHLGEECQAEDVWYEFTQRLQPKERKRNIIPNDATLISKSGSNK